MKWIRPTHVAIAVTLCLVLVLALSYRPALLQIPAALQIMGYGTPPVFNGYPEVPKYVLYSAEGVGNWTTSEFEFPGFGMYLVSFKSWEYECEVTLHCGESSYDLGRISNPSATTHIAHFYAAQIPPGAKCHLQIKADAQWQLAIDTERYPGGY